MPASKVKVSATVNGKTATVPRDAQRLTSQTPSKTPNSKRKPHDVTEGGRWIPSVVGLVYAEVEAGDAVEMVKKACNSPCKITFRSHKCRLETESSIETIAYVINSGVSGKGEHEGEPFTKFVTLYDEDGAARKALAKATAQLAAAKARVASLSK